MNGAPTDLPGPHWRPLARLVLFLLGVAVIIDAVAAKGQQIGQLVAGLVLVGIIPVDEFLSALARRFGRD